MLTVGSLRLLLSDFQKKKKKNSCGVSVNVLHACKLETSEVCLICTKNLQKENSVLEESL